MSAQGQRDSVTQEPIFTVEGRIGGRWWAWQRFRERDAAARELAQLAAEKRFDGVRLGVTIPGRDGAPPLSRDLVVVDGLGIHRPGEPAGGIAASAAAARAPQAYRPPAARAAAPPRSPKPEVPFFSARRLRADEILAELAARAAASSAPDDRPAPIDHVESRVEPRLESQYDPYAAAALAPPPEERVVEAARDDDAAESAAPESAPEAHAPEAHAPAAEPEPVAVEAEAIEPDAAPEPLTGEAGPFVPPPTSPDGFAAHRRADPLIDDDPPYLTAEDRLPDEEPGDYLIDDDVIDEPPPPRKRYRIPRQLVYTLGAGIASLLLAVTSYETTRLVFGLPDLLEEARVAVAGLTAGPERPIVVAARGGKAEALAKLLRGGFSANSEDAHGVPAVLVAARAGHANVVRMLLDAGADPNVSFGYGDTPMLATAREGLLTSLELMQAKGGQVNGRGGADLCATPLLVASASGKLDAVNFLLAKGASYDVLPGCRQGPMDVAMRYPRVREALEVAYRRRLASVRTPAQATPASATASTRGAPPVAARQPAGAAKSPPTSLLPPPHATVSGRPEAAADPRAYAPMMYGMTWRETLAAVKATAKECREVGRRYVACELKVRPWLDDIGTVEAWFDRADGDRFVSIEARSVELVDYSATRDGAVVRGRFDQIRRAIDQRLPQGMKPIVVRQAPNGIPFFESLKPEVNAGEFTAFWTDDGHRRPASIHLKLTGIDQRKGYYRLIVSNPQRSGQQQAAFPSK